MKLIIQRVHEASVTVDGVETGRTGPGLMILVGVGHRSNDADAEWLAAKVQDLRIFSDDDGKMNLSVRDIKGGILAISQFTLYGNAQKGRRPSFVDSAPPAEGERLYDRFCDALDVPLGRGVFGAHMDIAMTCDGPVTLDLVRESG